ncbi:MAG TPA: phenylalanine--tRNA ligase subunit alpha, partial [Deltaproteobacteria bacterium]|nr:phenylalanine--tRNA ligase subunit alpha [Deltaproteobacteria bacterium]
MIEQLAALETEALAAIQAAPDPASLQQVRAAWLGKKGQLTALLKGLRNVPPAERGAVGK